MAVKMKCPGCRRRFPCTPQQIRQLATRLNLDDRCPLCDRPIAISFMEVPKQETPTGEQPPGEAMRADPPPAPSKPPFSPLPMTEPVAAETAIPPFAPHPRHDGAGRSSPLVPPSAGPGRRGNVVTRWWKRRSAAQQWGLTVAVVVVLAIATFSWPAGTRSGPRAAPPSKGAPPRPTERPAEAEVDQTRGRVSEDEHGGDPPVAGQDPPDADSPAPTPRTKPVNKGSKKHPGRDP